MTSRLKLEMFDSDEAKSPTGERLFVTGAADLEDSQLKAFEAGFKAGWDDASASHQTEQAEVQEAIQRNLQELAFTFHDARTHVLVSLSQLFSEITARLLPAVAHASLPHVVAEALAPYADLVSEAPVHVRVHPSARAVVERTVGQGSGLPLLFVDDPGLTPGVVQLRLGTAETRIDLDAALAAITTAINDFFEQAKLERRHD